MGGYSGVGCYEGGWRVDGRVGGRGGCDFDGVRERPTTFGGRGKGGEVERGVEEEMGVVDSTDEGGDGPGVVGVDVGEKGGDGRRGEWCGSGGEGAGLRAAHAGEIYLVFVGGAACVAGIFIGFGGFGR